jgi:hypothetical protein
VNISSETQAARKKAQLARLAAKGSPEYAAIYAQQPEQLIIAAEQGAARKAVREAKAAHNTAALVAANVAAGDFGNIKVSKKGAK